MTSSAICINSLLIFIALAPRLIQSSSWNFCILHGCLSPHRVIKREPFHWPTLVTWSLHRPLIDQSTRGPNLVHPQNSLCVNAFNSDPSKLTPTQKYMIFFGTDATIRTCQELQCLLKVGFLLLFIVIAIAIKCSTVIVSAVKCSGGWDIACLKTVQRQLEPIILFTPHCTALYRIFAVQCWRDQDSRGLQLKAQAPETDNILTFQSAFAFAYKRL